MPTCSTQVACQQVRQLTRARHSVAGAMNACPACCAGPRDLELALDARQYELDGRQQVLEVSLARVGVNLPFHDHVVKLDRGIGVVRILNEPRAEGANPLPVALVCGSLDLGGMVSV